MLFATILRRLSNHSAARVLGAAALLSCALLAGGGSIAHAEHGGGGPIDASCTQEWQDSSGVWQQIPDKADIALAQGTPLRLTFEFSTQNFYRATFAAATNTNIFLGPQHYLPIPERVRTHSVKVQGRIGTSSYQTGYTMPLPAEDLPDGSDHIDIKVTSNSTGDTPLGSCDFTLTLLSNPSLDLDGDGILNSWETDGIDVDHDGTVDLHLTESPYNASPGNRDVFVEVDYMSCALSHPWSDCPSYPADHEDRPVGGPVGEPPDGALDDVNAAFNNAPPLETGPFFTRPGITLHPILDEAVPHIDDIPFTSDPEPSRDFGDLKNGLGNNLGPDHCGTGPGHGFFGTAADRASPNCENILFAKLLVFHYAIFGHSYRKTVTS